MPGDFSADFNADFGTAALSAQALEAAESAWTTIETKGNIVKLAPVPSATGFEFRVRAKEESGAVSGWSSIASILSASSGAPPPVTGLMGSFAGRDAIFEWTGPNVPDLTGYDVEIAVGLAVVHTERVKGESYAYSFEKNVEDNGFPAAPAVTATVYAVNSAGLRSIGESFAVANPAPAAPLGLVVSSTLSRLTVDIQEPTFSDYWQTVVKTAAVDDEAQAATAYVGQQHAGISVPVVGTGTNWVWVYFRDQFGQLGPPAHGSTDAVLIGPDDMQGAIWQIEPSSAPAPSSGTLESLWDADTSTGATFASAPTVEFAFPTVYLFDLVRFWATAAAQYYVQAFDEDAGAWVSVLGSPSAREPSSANVWTVKRFPKRHAARRVRIVFDRPLGLRELKFGSVVLGDEILGQNITATSSMQILSEDGTVAITGSGITIKPRPYGAGGDSASHQNLCWNGHFYGPSRDGWPTSVTAAANPLFPSGHAGTTQTRDNYFGSRFAAKAGEVFYASVLAYDLGTAGAAFALGSASVTPRAFRWGT